MSLSEPASKRLQVRAFAVDNHLPRFSSRFEWLCLIQELKSDYGYVSDSLCHWRLSAICMMSHSTEENNLMLNMIIIYLAVVCASEHAILVNDRVMGFWNLACVTLIEKMISFCVEIIFFKELATLIANSSVNRARKTILI